MYLFLNYCVQNQIRQFTTDITNAYLQALPDQQYIGFIAKEQSGWSEDRIYIHGKNTYGMVKAGRLWHEKRVEVHRLMGGEQCPSEPTLWVYRNQHGIVVDVTYVDDAATACSTPAAEVWFKSTLQQHLPIGACEPLSRFLGMDMRIVHPPGATSFYIEVSLDTYIKQIPQKLALSSHFLKPKSVPVIPLTSFNEERFLLEPTKSLADLDHTTQSKLGVLRWASHVYPMLLRAISFPQNVDNALLYLLHRALPPLAFHKSITAPPYVFQALVDARMPPANCFGILLRANPQSGSFFVQARKSKMAHLSSADAECNGTCEAAKQVMFFRAVIQWLYAIATMPPTEVYTDNQVVLRQLSSPVPTPGSRYFMLRLNAVRSWVKAGFLVVLYIKGDENVSDMLTKALIIKRYKYFELQIQGTGLTAVVAQVWVSSSHLS